MEIALIASCITNVLLTVAVCTLAIVSMHLWYSAVKQRDYLWHKVRKLEADLGQVDATLDQCVETVGLMLGSKR